MSKTRENSSHIDQNINGNKNQQAGRDINNYYANQQQDVKMQFLIEEYKKEQVSNPNFNEIIVELDRYLNPVKSENQNIIGLENKLKNGQFDDYIEDAIEFKDIFCKKVEQYRLSKAAQQIFLYILTDVVTIFRYKIFPLICNNTEHEIIMSKINEEIIDFIQKKLGENILDIYSDCISGMLYFLTGNCHIKWSKI